MSERSGASRRELPTVVPYVLAAVAVVLVLASFRPGWAAVAGALALLLLPGRWWRWRTRRFRRGVKALRRGESARARRELRAFLEETEGDERFFRLQPWFNLGRSYPYLAAARSNLGIAALREGRLSAAVAEFEAALDEAPGFTQARYGLGVAAWRAGRLDEAEAAARRASEGPHPHTPALVLLGAVRHERGDEAGVRQALESLRERGHDPEELVRRFEAEWGSAGSAGDPPVASGGTATR